MISTCSGSDCPCRPARRRPQRHVRRRCAAGSCRRFARRLGGVLEQVQNHLQQLVGIAKVSGSEGS
jgi:hypothetical protein